jgi:hypothetical protein
MSSPEGPSSARSWGILVLWLVVAAVGLIGWLVAFTISDAARVWRALLVSFLFFTSLAAGLVMWSPTLVLTRGNWADRLERTPLAGMGFAIPSVVALAVLWAGGPTWAPWVNNADVPWKAWLTWPTVFARDTGMLIVFWVVAALYVRRRRQGRPTKMAAWLVLTYIFVFSLLAFDLVLALALRWTSAVFGWYFIAAGMYMAACSWALAAAWRGVDRDRLQDVARLVFVFSLITTYFMFCQLITMWYGNLPSDTVFAVPRMNFEPWRWVSLSLMVVVYLGPLVLLLPVRAKRSRGWLGVLTALLLVGLWVQTWWLVEPTFELYPHFGLAEVAGVLLLGGVLGATMMLYQPYLPEDLPKETTEW